MPHNHSYCVRSSHNDGDGGGGGGGGGDGDWTAIEDGATVSIKCAYDLGISIRSCSNGNSVLSLLF